MSDGMGREFTYLSSHATNRYFIPNWGIYLELTLKIMTEKKEMLLIEKTQWEAIVSKVRDLTLKVSMLKDKCVAQPQYYNNKELCKVLGVEERLIQKYREQGLLAYSKIGDKYWYSQQDVLDFLEKTRHPAF